MSRYELNLAGLRHNRIPRLIPPHAATTLQSRTQWNDLALTRRDFFGAAAFAGLSLSPTLNAVEAVLAAGEDSFTSEVSETRIAFTMRGRERWVIDTRAFGGRPRLMANRTSGRFRIELTGATFPGTCLSADFVCELRRGIFSWEMSLAFALGHFHSRCGFEQWLMGHASAESSIRIQQSVCRLGLEGQLTLAGSGTARFAPDWQFELRGHHLARFEGHQAVLASDAVRLALLPPQAPSFVLHPPHARTLMALRRDNHSWSFTPSFLSQQPGHLLCPSNAFTDLHLETWDDSRGTAVAALLLEAKEDDAHVWFHPAGMNEGAGGEPFGLPLSGARYLRVFHSTEAEPQQALLAQISRRPAWLTLHGCRLELGTTPDTPPFEMLHGEHGLSVCCEPSLRRIGVPLPGAFVEPMEVPGEPRIQLVQLSIEKRTPGILQQPVAPAPPPAPVQPPLQQQVAPLRSELSAIILSDFRSLLQVQGPLTVSVVRPEDLLVLKFEFRNLTLQVGPGQPPRLVRTAGAPRPVVVVHFPPQHIAEQAFRQSESSLEPVTFPIAAQVAGPSRLVFEVPDDMPVIPFALESLLDWSRFQQIVARAAAAPPPPPPPAPSMLLLPSRELSPFLKQSPELKVIPRGVPLEPAMKNLSPQLQQVQPAPPPAVSPLQQLRPGLEAQIVLLPPPAPPKKEELPNLTAIEAPYRLFLSPSPMGGWMHAQKPILLNGRTELWHTRLGVRKQDSQGRWWVDESDRWYRTLRAIWSPDYVDDPNPNVYKKSDPFLMSLKAPDRQELVHLMADAQLDTAGWPSRVARADRFMLTSLGAWMSLRYASDRVAPLNLIGWRHDAMMGRDQYVKVVRLGYLFPLGHKALLVTVTERTIEKVGQDIVAVLRQRQFIEVREPIKTYPAPGQQSAPSQGRTFPYTSVRLTSLITPALDLPTPPQAAFNGISPDLAFWPYVAGQPFRFGVIGEDFAGQSSEFSIPLVFLMASVAEDPALVQRVIDPDGPGPLRGYSDDPAQRNVAGLSGQKIAFAPSRPSGETILETVDLAFGAEMPSAQTVPSLKNVQPAFYPTVDRSGIRIPAVQHLLGTTAPVLIRYAAVYKTLGFNHNGNAGEVFAELPTPLSLEFFSDKTGGLATPFLDIRGLSRQWGPVGGNLDAVAKGSFVPTDYFRRAANPDDPAQRAKQANLLGSLYLGDVVAAGPPPLLKTRLLPPADRGRQTRDLLRQVARHGEGLAIPAGGPPGYQAEPRPPENPSRLWISFHFETEDLKSDPLNLFLPWLGDQPGAPGCCKAKLTLHSTTKVGIRRPGQPTADSGSSSRGVLSNFQLSLFKLVIVSFREVRFTVKSDSKPEMLVRLADQDPVRFGGALKFVDEIRKFLTSEIFDKIPNVSSIASSVGAKVERSLALPNVNIGMFAISNIAFKFWLELPYANQPITFVFAFANPADPAILSVGTFGGGFCFVLGISAGGIQKIEAWFLFGGQASLDIGVASGGVTAMCGIYYSIAKNPTGGQDVTLGGLLRLSGHLSVLGLVTVSVEFKLQLEYDLTANKLAGEASLVVKIELLCFSDSVTLRVGKEFPGSTMTAALENDLLHLVSDGRPHRTQGPGAAPPRPRPPRIADLLSEADWMQYSSAFAAVT
jgi:hypothetical protein